VVHPPALEQRLQHTQTAYAQELHRAKLHECQSSYRARKNLPEMVSTHEARYQGVRFNRRLHDQRRKLRALLIIPRLLTCGLRENMADNSSMRVIKELFSVHSVRITALKTSSAAA
jgi:hypothetical protein